jgi:hypothetical protein
MRHRSLVILACSLTPLVFADLLRAQGARADSAAFVARIGVDTVAVERWRRHGDVLDGDLVLRSPRTSRTGYRVHLSPEGHVDSIRTWMVGPSGEPTSAGRRSTTTISSDSLVLQTANGDGGTTQRLAAPRGTVPIVNSFYSFALYELGMQRARAELGAGRNREVPVVFYPIGSPSVWRTTAMLGGADTVRVRWIAPGTSLRGRFDDAGRLVAMDGLETTIKFMAERRPWLDVATLAAAFERRDQSGAGLGSLSVRDTLKVALRGTTLWIDYGRPARRGRVIFGELVKWGEVWRLGANAATQLETSRPIVVGGVRVPAGRYSLFMIPERDGGTLIINRETGQWGTSYRAELDLARVALTTTSAEPTERFTIELTPDDGKNATLRLRWADKEYRVGVVAE